MPITIAKLGPSWDLVADIQILLHYHFMQNAFLAGTLIAIVAGAVGSFMVIRGQSFAGHTLAQVGFAGAAGAALLNIEPVIGLLVCGVAAALGIGVLGEQRARNADVAIGTVLAVCLGLGLLFTRLSTANVSGVYSVLFGATLGIADGDVRTIVVVSAITLGILIVIGRPLLFASLDPRMAAARGVPVRALSMIFLVLLAFAVAEAVQVVGVLLIFALLVTPPAIAQIVTSRPGRAIMLSIGLAVLFTWLGLAVSFFSSLPLGFLITTFAFGTYGLVIAARWGRTLLATRWREEAAI